MASITIRQLDETLKSRLRIQAARHRRSMEEEARVILKAGLGGQTAELTNLADAIRRHVEPLGGVDLVLPLREPLRKPPKLNG